MLRQMQYNQENASQRNLRQTEMLGFFCTTAAWTIDQSLTKRTTMSER